MTNNTDGCCVICATDQFMNGTQAEQTKGHEEMKKCTSCGTEANGNRATTCKNCGTSFSKQSPDGKQKSPARAEETTQNTSLPISTAPLLDKLIATKQTLANELSALDVAIEVMKRYERV